MCSSDLVIFGTSDAKTLVEAYQANPQAKAIIMAQDMTGGDVSKYGVISLKGKQGNLLANIVEKPAKGGEPSHLVSYGRYLLTQEVFKHLHASNTGLDGELWTVDAITTIASTDEVLVETTKGQWMTTGDPENYFLAHLKYVLDHESYANKVKEFINNVENN